MISGQIFHDRYRLIAQLGLGGYSEVWKVEDIHSDLILALKIFNKQNEEGIKLCREEFLKTYNLDHKNILRPSHFDVCEARPYMVMAFISGGTLQSKLHEMDDVDCRNLVEQIGNVLNYIHHKDHPIIHGDIKPDNILINEKGEFILTDFGISQKLKQVYTQTMSSSLLYEENIGATPLANRPPELIRFKNWNTTGPTTKSDIWSFGMLLYYIKHKEYAFNAEGGLGQLMMMVGGGLSLSEAVNYEKELDKYDIRKLIHQCLALNPQDRPDIIQLDAINKNPLEVKSELPIAINSKHDISYTIKKENKFDLKRIAIIALIPIFCTIYYLIYAYRSTQNSIVNNVNKDSLAVSAITEDSFTTNKIALDTEANSSKTEQQLNSTDIRHETNNKPYLSKQQNTTSSGKSEKNQENTIPTNEVNNIPKSIPNEFPAGNKTENHLEQKKENMPLISTGTKQDLAKTNEYKTDESITKKEVVSQKGKVTFNMTIGLKLKEDISITSSLKKNDIIGFEVLDDLISQNITIISKGSYVAGNVKNINKKNLEIEIPKVYSSGGTPIKILLPKVFFKVNENGIFALKGTKIEIKTNEFKEVLVQ